MLGETRDEPHGVGLVDVDQPSGEEQIAGARRADRVDETRAVGRREAIAERAGDRHAEAGVGRAHAKIAGERDDAAAASGHSVHLRDGRHGDALQPIDDGVEPLLVADAVVSGPEIRELADVGARGERVAGAADDERTRTAGSASTASHASTSASYIAQVSALRASGRLKVRRAIIPDDSNRVSGVDNS